MALNKLVLDGKTSLASQVVGQNANIEQIDSFMTDGGIENIILAPGLETTTSGTVQVKTFNGFANIKGAIVNRDAEMRSGALLATLPTSARPSNTLIVLAIGTVGNIQIRIMPTGEIYTYSTIPTNVWVSLSGITYML